MKKLCLIVFAVAMSVCGSLSNVVAAEDNHPAARPNIIFIYADDMGVGDVAHNGGKAPTPSLDRLAQQGMRLTDVHTTSSVCTPSRYGLLTGRYNWRSRLQAHVFSNPLLKPLIKDGEPTVASLLKSKGYQTACVGKWHMGFDWTLKENFKKSPDQKGSGWEIDFSGPVKTPTVNGFDYFFGILASLDMPPYVFVKNDKATAIPTISNGFRRMGPATEDFTPELCLPAFAEKSVAFIDQAVAHENAAPFFLYLPLTSPHTPITPNEQWKGKSGIGKYGDFLMETDWVVGEILAALDKHNIAENTLVIFSSDNGCSPAAGIPQLAKKGHIVSGNLRGHKADIYEGGHRVPMIARWPGEIKAGSTSDNLITLADFYATCADVTGATVPPGGGVDSVSFLPTLIGEQQDRAAIVMHSIDGLFAVREGDWKLCLCSGSGGWSAPRSQGGDAPKVQLFNLKNDIGEQNNLAREYPEKVQAMTETLEQYIADGRSTPGEKQENDVEVVIWKKEPAPKKPKKKK